MDLLHTGGDIHGKVHDGAGCRNKNACNEDVCQIEIIKARVQQRFGKGLNGTMQVKEICGDHCQSTCQENTRQ